MRRRSIQRGFTLIEVMVVVAIIAILSIFLISLKQNTYGANTQNSAMQLASTFSESKMRSESTRRWHRVDITPTTVTQYQWSAMGLTTPPNPTNYTCSLPTTNCWQFLTQTKFDKNVVLFNGQTGVDAAGGLTPTGPNATLALSIDFKPDGSSTGGTVFLSDTQGAKPWRTFVYKATGGAYARAGW